MYRIKQIPEDFIVKEIIKPDIKENGEYAYYWLKKEEYTTLRAVQSIAQKIRIPSKDVGFAGSKDKKAVTEQLVSIKKGKKQGLKMEDIELTFLGYGENPVSLGDNKGNEFTITVRNLNNFNMNNVKRFVNYFGEQRFSKNNAEIGKKLVKKRFKEAIEMILKDEKEYKQMIEDELSKSPNNFVGALRKIPKKILMMHLHAYQSRLWNETAEQLKNEKDNKNIPIVGFGTEIPDEKTKNIVEKILKRENLKPRDFIIRELQGLSPEGHERKLFADIEGLKVIEKSEDELNQGKKKVIVNFKLKKGCYATEAIKALFSQPT